MAIAYIDPATNGPVEREPWRWVAIYNDGSRLDQFEVMPGKAVFHKFADIDKDKVSQFRLEHDTQAPIIIRPPKGAKLVHAYTTAVKQELTADGEYQVTNTYRGYKFGYVLDGNDYGIFIDHDNSVNIINDFKTVTVAGEL
jgi:hypothetical protein